MQRWFEREKCELVIHLAAQAGVRHSIDDPHAYTESNVSGFLNVLEGCRRARVAHPDLCASSSSVYAGQLADAAPLSRTATDSPVSLYAATKKANELMAHCYTHLFGIRNARGCALRCTDRGAGRTWRCSGSGAGDCARRKNRCLKLRPDAAGLHLSRRCRRGCDKNRRGHR